MNSTSIFRFSIGCYFLVLTAFMANACLCPDAYYYWSWSKHLQLSYYDGSPLIAYAIYLLTTLFGQHEFSIYMLGILSAVITSVFIYQISLLFFSRSIGRMAALVWLLSPGVVRYFFMQTTYNSLLIIFWSATLYFFSKLIVDKRIRYFYGCGISIGLMLLAKYTGILLCFSLFLICLIYKNYRFILKSFHFYMSLFLAIILFSPVLIWNYQHDWISFSYQLHHGYVTQRSGIYHQLVTYIVGNIFDYSVVFILGGYLLVKYRNKILTHPYIIFTMPTLFVWLFFCISACFSDPQTNWNAPAFFTGILLFSALLNLFQNSISHDSLGFYKPFLNFCNKIGFRKNFLFLFCCLLLAIGSFFYILGSRFPYFYAGSGPGWSEVYSAKNMLEKVNPRLYEGKVIVANGYLLAAFAERFWKGTLGVYGNSNQYQLWWQEALPRLTPGKIIYLDYTPSPRFPSGVDSCRVIFYQQYVQKRLFHSDFVWHFYCYQCFLHPVQQQVNK